MFVFSQDRHTIITKEGVYEVVQPRDEEGNTQEEWLIVFYDNNRPIIMGQYSSNEEAIGVMKDLFRAIDMGKKCFYIY